MTLTTRLHLADLFDGLNKEEHQEIREFAIERNPTLDAMIKGFESVLDNPRWNEIRLLEEKELYDACLEHHPEQYIARDITQFLLQIAPQQEREGFIQKAGLFVSSLMNEAKEDTIHLVNHTMDWIYGLGYKNKDKHIQIKGYAGRVLGFQMQGGIITVEGDCENGAGRLMSGGKIHVYGNAGKTVGCAMHDGEIIVEGNTGGQEGLSMRGGKVIINGNAADQIGYWMSGGELHLNGNYQSLMDQGHIEGGNIYHKGIPIVKDGKIL